MSAGNIVRPARAGSQDTFAMPGTGVLGGSPSCQIGMQLLAGLASVGAKAALAAGAEVLFDALATEVIDYLYGETCISVG